jgi:hypothetical protein
VIRQRGSTTRRGDDQQEDPASSAKEIGRMLRDAREERGLDLLAVHDRLSRPITHLEALELGNLAGLPDQALALSTLRRYAAFLGLDGDALALQMIDAWSASPPMTENGSPRGDGGPPVTRVVAAVTTGPDHLRAFTQTGEVPKVGGASTSAAGGSGAYGYGVTSGPPTGTFPVVPRQDLQTTQRALAKARRRLRAPRWLKVVTWVSVILLLVVAVGFGLYQQRPQWLAKSHILRVSGPGGGPASPAADTPTPAKKAPSVAVTSFTSQGANYAVDASKFTVAVATSGPCWVQVTSAASATPLLSGVQSAGKRATFVATGTIKVEVGSSAVAVFVFINGKGAFLNQPHVVPYTYAFTPAPKS